MKAPISSRLFIWAIAMATCLAVGCFRNPATKKMQTRLLSYASERKIGEETKKKILEEYKVYESTAVTGYVDKIGQKLAYLSDRPTVQYEFLVVDSDLVNAFAVPGGFIFVTRGLLENVGDEAELAMVLAHEISHITAYHGVQMIQKEMGQNALTILGTIGAAFTMGPEAMLMVANTADLFSALYLLGYSREHEKEADYLGLQYILRAGYDPRASLTFLKKLESDNDKAQGWDLYFRTHPPIPERIKIIEGMVGKGDRDESKSNRDEFERIQALLPRVKTEERGVIVGQRYINPAHELVLNVPANWKFTFSHPQALVSFETLDEKGLGLLIVVELSSMTTSAEELAYRYTKDNGFRFVAGRNVLYAAGYGFIGQYQGGSPKGEFMDIRLYATIRRGKGYILVCEVPFDKLANYILDLESILRALQFSRSKDHSTR